MGYLKKLAGLFGYDAADTSTKRKAANTRDGAKSVDSLLTSQKRKQLVANARDIQQNYSVAAWAVRQHLDYVTSFSFQAATESDELNERIESLMARYARPMHCDVAWRHSLPRFIRLAESRAVVDGDCGIIKLNSGHLQGIEGDRIRDPEKTEGQNWQHGVLTTQAGRALRYSIHKRTNHGFEHERNVLASNFLQLGYFERFDQVRGVSPLAAAINSFRDTYEGIDYALAKLKVSQLFALAIYSESAEGFGNHTSDGATVPKYNVDFGKGPVKLELDPGDKAEFLDSKTPSTELQAFTRLVVQIALKSLDIPFSFFSEDFTNFAGSRMAGMGYEKSCHAKRERVKELLDRITFWRLAMYIRDGELKLPAGMSLANVKWDWIHSGTPWYDPAKEIKADILGIDAGLITRTQVIRERHGKDFRDVCKTLAKEEEFMRECGLTVSAKTSVDDPENAIETEDEEENGDQE